jgi:hypothetical protein
MATMLDKSLGDLRREITDLQQDNYDMNRLCLIINVSKDSLKETEKSQQQILNQLQLFETSLTEINQILRANIEQKAQLEQQQQQSSKFIFDIIYIYFQLCIGDDFEIRAKLMALNAEALECRAAVVQLQQGARLVLNKAVEIEKRANDELAQQALEMKAKQQEIERNRGIEFEKRVQSDEERQRLKVKTKMFVIT